ncbi:MAG: hypothetical protein ACOYLU_06930 [Limisphaerales bacterium]
MSPIRQSNATHRGCIPQRPRVFRFVTTIRMKTFDEWETARAPFSDAIQF